MYVLIRRVKLNIIINLLQALAHTHTHTKHCLLAFMCMCALELSVDYPSPL